MRSKLPSRPGANFWSDGLLLCPHRKRSDFNSALHFKFPISIDHRSMQKFFYLFLLWSVSIPTDLTAAKKDMPPPRNLGPGIVQKGFIRHKAIRECSGVAASLRHPGILWIHNDGPRPILYAMTAEGNVFAEFSLKVEIEDWEDIAVDDQGHVYLADIGNNDRKRKEVAIHQFIEPDPTAAASVLAPKQSWTLRFPKKSFDTESFFVAAGHGYLISKETDDKTADLFRFPLSPSKGVVTLEKMGALPIQSPVAAAALSADNRLMAVLAKAGVYLFKIQGDPARAINQQPTFFPFRHDKSEGCTFTLDGLVVTTEDREIFLFTQAAFRLAK